MQAVQPVGPVAALCAWSASADALVPRVAPFGRLGCPVPNPSPLGSRMNGSLASRATRSRRRALLWMWIRTGQRAARWILTAPGRVHARSARLRARGTTLVDAAYPYPETAVVVAFCRHEAETCPRQLGIADRLQDGIGARVLPGAEGRWHRRLPCLTAHAAGADAAAALGRPFRRARLPGRGAGALIGGLPLGVGDGIDVDLATVSTAQPLGLLAARFLGWTLLAGWDTGLRGDGPASALPGPGLRCPPTAHHRKQGSPERSAEDRAPRADG
jgi:hypothetical protein